MFPHDLEQNSLLIVAHPDDEILWFSSLLHNIKKVIICFTPFSDNLRLTREFIQEYPLKNTQFLALKGFGGYHKVNFFLPVETRCGVLIKNSLKEAIRYRKNCLSLKQNLEELIPEKSHVFTHNPWGEYGHEEHVQVSNIISNMRQRKNLKVWHNNYGSRKAFSLMKRTIFATQFESFKRSIDLDFVRYMRSFYLEKGCWTWDPSWQWFEEETFFSSKNDLILPTYQHTIPLNLFNVSY